MYFWSIHSSSSSPAPCRMDLQTARKTRVRGLDRCVVGEHTTPAECVDDQRRRQIPPVGVNGVAVAAADRGRLELGIARMGLPPQQRAQLAVIEGGERPGQLPSRRSPGRVHDKLVKGLAQRARKRHRFQPTGGDPASRGLALADLIAIDHKHARPRVGQFARDGQPGEGSTADKYVAIALEGGAQLPALRRSNRHTTANDMYPTNSHGPRAVRRGVSAPGGVPALGFDRCKHL